MGAKYKRILLKLGGESLAGKEGFGIDPVRADDVAAKIKRIRDHEVEVAIVIGGATCGVEWMGWRMAWIGRPPITWACWRR